MVSARKVTVRSIFVSISANTGVVKRPSEFAVLNFRHPPRVYPRMISQPVPSGSVIALDTGG